MRSCSPSTSGFTSRAHLFSCTATIKVRVSRRLSRAAPPHAPAGTTMASSSSRQISAGCALSSPSRSDGARLRFTRTHGKNVKPSSSAQLRGESSGSRSRVGRAGAWAHGTRNSFEIRCEMMASAPPMASTPEPARYACSIASSSSSGKRATTAMAVQPASTSLRAAARSASGRRSVPQEAPAGDIAISTPTGTSVVVYAATLTPSVARAASAACRWRRRRSSSIPASSSRPTRWLVEGRSPHRPAANSSSAYPSTYCIASCGQVSIAPFITLGCVTSRSTTAVNALATGRASPAYPPIDAPIPVGTSSAAVYPPCVRGRPAPAPSSCAPSCARGAAPDLTICWTACCASFA
mmetsp:Transcript_3116/g.6508  ORF Transcript_3116/g.6508 Transcript_3116/m.6508 type:complete len:352 (+) Transcript_3116:279-1334(+)